MEKLQGERTREREREWVEKLRSFLFFFFYFFIYFHFLSINTKVTPHLSSIPMLLSHPPRQMQVPMLPPTTPWSKKSSIRV